MRVTMKKLQNYLYQRSAFYLKLIVVTLPVGLSVLASSNVFAQVTNQETSSNEDDEDEGDSNLDEMISGITGEQDGDDDEPDRPGKAPKPRKINSKISTTYGAKQALRWKINKQAFFEGYVDEAIATQDDPYKTPGSKFAFGVNGNYIWNGFTLTAGADYKRSYTDVFGAWDGIQDATYSFGVSRKISLSKQWALSPSFKQTIVRSDLATKELTKTAFSFPFSYALNKVWTIKALTVGFATQTYTNRVLPQTDLTSTYSTGVAYKLSEKSSLDLTLGREIRTSNQSSAEYSKTSITPKLDYKISPTSSIGISFGYETHTTSKEEFSRWIIVPKLQLRKDI